MRTCIGCLQTDDHPRHVIDTGTGEDVTWHFDCHAAAGCESCAQQSAGADGTGEAMLAAILANSGHAAQEIDPDEAERVGLVEKAEG
jgi:hypothetical protein